MCEFDIIKWAKKYLNLCETCKFTFATCSASRKFGKGHWNDNVYSCEKYKHKTPKRNINKYCECSFVMIRRDEKTDKAYCFECKKEVKE